ncbi:MAG: ABC transporter permease [Lachnospiraceae bacterium]|jgi:taurine transport system permease protein|nr:ABC transporter permease [Lachnospiraceae bacterium]MCI8996474.1 ABC transporter permease [Lachnospiraceae bacterium]
MSKAGRQLIKKILLGCLGVAMFLGIWQLLMTVGIISQRTMSTPGQVMETFLVKLSSPDPDGATVQEHFWSSLKLAMAGFFSAILVGIPMGLVMGYYRTARRLLNPVFEIIRPIPPIAWIPIVILFLGIGMPAKVFIVFMAAFVPCVINSYTGVKQTNPVYIQAAKTMGAGHWRIFTRVCIPSAVPMVFTGIRISLGSSWSTLVAAEMLASTNGLGYMIQMGRTMIRPDTIVVGMLVIGCTGALMSILLGRVEQHIAPWRD